MMTIDFWGDITCPFCYIGEVLLKRELEAGGYEDQVEVRWRSCLLAPELPLNTSFTWLERMEKVEDPEELQHFQKSRSVLDHLAEKYGLENNLEYAWSHNSQRAARLLKVATEEDRMLEVATLFGRGYFSEGRDFSKLEELKRVAIEANLPAEAVAGVLEGDLYLSEVKEDQVLAAQYAYNFVPTIYFGDEVMLEGVVTPEQIREALQKALK